MPRRQRDDKETTSSLRTTNDASKSQKLDTSTDSSNTSTNAASRVPPNSAAAARSKAVKNRKINNNQQQQPNVLTIQFPAGHTREYPGAPLDLFDQCGIDDPAVVLEWNPDACAALLAEFTRPPPNRRELYRPFWFLIGNTVQDLQRSIMTYITATSLGIVPHTPNSIVAPLTLSQFAQVTNKLSSMMSHAKVVAAYARWQQGNNNQVPVGPIAEVFHISDNSKLAKAVGDNIQPADPDAVQLFK